MIDQACECLNCCDGEHEGLCYQCAGWGETDGHECAHCNGKGICPACRGANFACIECCDEGYVWGALCHYCGSSDEVAEKEGG